MCKTLRQLFAIYLRHIIYIKYKMCHSYITRVCVLLFVFPIRKGFVSYQTKKNNGCLSLISHFFTCTSCFQLPASTCRTWSCCTEIGSCFTNKQRSDLGLRQKAASVRSQESCINLASCLSSSEFLGSSLLAWFLITPYFFSF